MKSFPGRVDRPDINHICCLSALVCACLRLSVGIILRLLGRLRAWKRVLLPEARPGRAPVRARPVRRSKLTTIEGWSPAAYRQSRGDMKGSTAWFGGVCRGLRVELEIAAGNVECREGG